MAARAKAIPKATIPFGRVIGQAAEVGAIGAAAQAAQRGGDEDREDADVDGGVAVGLQEVHRDIPFSSWAFRAVEVGSRRLVAKFTYAAVQIHVTANCARPMVMPTLIAPMNGWAMNAVA